MTRKSKREIERKMEELDPTTGVDVFKELWKRSAADENWREDDEFMERLQAATDAHSWPARPWGDA